MTHPAAASGVAAFGDFTTRPRMLLLAAMAVPVGLFGVASAWALLHLIALVTGVAYYGQLTTAHGILISLDRLGAWSVLVPVAGAFLIGLMARYGSEKIRGHGIPEALEAILIGQSRIDARVAFFKPLSSAIAIGTGGPFGAEGPIIMTGGALGSLFAQCFRMTSAERKTLLVAGAAAGMTGVFATPIAAVLIAVELLLFEWKPRSFIPVLVACMTAAVARGFVLPLGPLFPHHGAMPLDALTLLDCIGLGLVCGALSGLLTAMVYAAEDLFLKLPIHWMWWPMLGAVAVGVGGLIDPRALGVGYIYIDALLNGQMTGWSSVTLLVVKALIWAIALGSGTSGGVLAPLLIMGGCAGAIAGGVLPHAGAGDWALIGMAATLGGTMRAPLTAMMFAVELTGDASLSVPLLAACGAAMAFTVLLLKRSILTEKLARRGHHIVREYAVDPFELTRAADVMVRRVDTLPASMTLGAIVALFTDGAEHHKAYPVVDAADWPVAMAHRADVLEALAHPERHDQTLAAALGGRPMVLARPDEPLSIVVARMVAQDTGRVPVVAADSGALVGLIARKDLLRVRAQLLEDEQTRGVFLGRWRPRARGAAVALDARASATRHGGDV